ncbi:MAG: SLC13/DASS family transporter [Bacteroidetes bacterium]|nr:SLC13/DASS family transporter [Bacteroidota bacterium]
MDKRYYRIFNLFVGPLLFLLVYFAEIQGLSHEGKALMASTIWIAYWWITEATELAITSLLPIVLFPLSGAISLKATASEYGNPFIFLFMGGFIIGLAIEKWNLHKRIAFNIIKKIGTRESSVLLGFMIATAFISMWISNTATTVIMLPIGMSVAMQFKSDKHFGKSLMLGIAYAASIGGMATLIGTPPNIIMAGVLKEFAGIEISFFHWMIFATPFSIILLIVCWWFLSRNLKREKSSSVLLNTESMGKITAPEKRVLIVFLGVAFFWITRTFLWNKLIPELDDTLIAMVGAIILFLIPSGQNEDKLMNWNTAKALPWDVLLIFGAGLAIAKGFSETDLTRWIAQQFANTHFYPLIILLIIIAAINFLTEITSNTATASIVLPILYSISYSLQLSPLSLLVGAAIASSCAFMLPVATPPNAIVFSSGEIKIKDMIRAGFFMNIVSILLIYFFVITFIGVLE